MRSLLLLLALITLPILLAAQEKQKSRREIRAERKTKIEQSVKKAIESKKLTFVVRNAIPATGPSISLNSDYDLKISNDSVYSFLPYFGEVHNPDYGAADGGIKFETIVYNYKVKFNKKTKFYEIRFKVIQPKDTYRINLNISSSGYGNLKFFSNARQTISYAGILAKLLE